MITSKLAACVLAIALAPMGCKSEPSEAPPEIAPPPPVDRTRLTKLSEDLVARGHADDQARRAVKLDAITPSAAPCPVSPNTLVPQDASAADTDSGRRIQIAKRTMRVILITDELEASKPVRVNGPAERMAQSFADDAKMSLDIHPDDLDRVVADLTKQSAAFDHDYALTLQLTSLVQPTARGSDTFDAGQITGTAYLWSRADHRIVCTAPLAGHGSDSIVLHGQTAADIDSQESGMLHANLVEAAVLDALPRLTAVAAK